MASLLKSKVKSSIDILSKVGEQVYLAYSGGKDSTALAILVKDYVNSGGNIKKVTLIHNDTMSETDLMEQWARQFMSSYSEEMGELNVEVEKIITRPDPFNTFYWRVFVRGYPAPTFSFRWCVYELKIRPTRGVIPDGSVLLVGLRDDESSSRSGSNKRKFTVCSISHGDCMADRYMAENNVIKVAPIRNWTEADIWNYLKEKELSNGLFSLYFNDKVRYGCWHCTLIKTQWSLRLDKRYAYFDALRLLYRALSDIKELRMTKKVGYSTLGALRMNARALLLKFLLKTEILSGITLYGLDESTINGYSLREIFTKLEQEEADDLISKDRFSKGRFTTVMDLREADDRWLDELDKSTRSHPSRYFDGDDLIRALLW